MNIKGKEYMLVNDRIKEFWRLYPNGKIITELVSNNDGVCVFKATVYKNPKILAEMLDKGTKYSLEATLDLNVTDRILPDATGYAYEVEGSTFINKTSYIENCETSAVGRALGILGIGIDTSIASAEEVQNAILQQNTVIDENKVQALKMSINNHKLGDAIVEQVLEKYGYEDIEDIKVCDYMRIVKEFEEEIK